MVMEEEVNIVFRKERKDKNNKYQYQVNSNIFVDILRNDLIYAFLGNTARIVHRRLKQVV